MSNPILIFAAHSDDELTMAGTIAKLSKDGYLVTVVVMTDGSEGYACAELESTIADVRKKEAIACDRVLGISKRIFLDFKDMGLVYSRETVQACIRVIRSVRPEKIFTHGPEDMHGDHRATHRISMDAVWHSGQPVSSALGKIWKTPAVYYYKGVSAGLPKIVVDVTSTAYKRYEALATQESQFTLFRSTRKELLARAKVLRKSKESVRETFWIAETNTFPGFICSAATGIKPR